MRAEVANVETCGRGEEAKVTTYGDLAVSHSLRPARDALKAPPALQISHRRLPFALSPNAPSLSRLTRPFPQFLQSLDDEKQRAAVLFRAVPCLDDRVAQQFVIGGRVPSSRR